MEDESYQKIREELQKPEEKLEKAVEPEKAAEPDAALGAPSERQKAEPEKAVEPEKAAEPQKAAALEKAAKPEKPQKKKKAEDGAPKEGTKERPKPPRMICEGCGRSYSIHTKRHVCKAPKGFEKKENVPSSPTPPAPPVVPAERQITLADVTQFLFAESKARRDRRRDDLLAKMF